jgi:hypothetical protein
MFIKRLLLPGEKVMFRGKVHYIIFLPGVVYIALALYIAYMSQGVLRSHLLMRHFERMDLSPESVLTFLKWVAGYFFVMGAIKVLKALALAASTELVVTDRRVIVKSGVTTTTTLEIECRKITSVIVQQTPFGQMLNYGWVEMQGFSGIIRGLPVMSRPYKLQQVVNKLSTWQASV